MGKTQGPLFSLSAHGKLARSLIYKKRNQTNLFHKYHYPKKDASLKQWTQRHIIGLLTAHWQCMSDADKLTWNTNAKKLTPQITGFPYFIKKAQTDLKTYHGLCGYWSMNEKTGNQILDYSGNGNHGTLKPTYPSDCPTREASFQKEYGKALLFNGTSDYVECDPADSLDVLTAFTFEIWLKKPSGLQGVILNHWYANGETDPSYYFTFDSADQCIIYLSKNGDTPEYRPDFYINTDHNHLVITWDGTTVKSYLNEIPAGNTLQVSAPINSSALPLIIGGDTVNNFWFTGPFSTIRIYNRALPLDEIKKHYQLLRMGKKRQPLLVH